MFKSLKNDCKFTEWWKMFYSKGFGLIYLEQLKGKNQDNHLVSFSWRVDLFHWSKSKIKGDVAKWLFVVEQKSDKTKGKASQQYIKTYKTRLQHLTQIWSEIFTQKQRNTQNKTVNIWQHCFLHQGFITEEQRRNCDLGGFQKRGKFNPLN